MNDRSPCVIANAIRMKRVQHKGPFLIVEGSSDARFYKMFINHKACRVVPANSKEAVLQVVSSLESEVEGILGIVVFVDSFDANLMEKVLRHVEALG